jgi:glycosyltransferase involved in cell wall biosynthesis
MSRLPAVSVVMPVHNGEPYLREAVESVLGQTFGDFEFIIIDDGSTDATASIVRSYRDSRIRLESHPKRGFAHSLNRGFALAVGRYVARMDADDRSAPERFGQQVEQLELRPSVAVIGTAITRIDAAGRTLVTEYYLTHDLELRHELAVRCPFAHGSTMIRKSMFARTAGYRHEFWPAEDYDLWRQLAAVGELANIPRALYFYRENPLGLTGQHTARMDEAARRISSELLADPGYRRDIPLRSCLSRYRGMPADRLIENYYRILAECAHRGELLPACWRFVRLAAAGPAAFKFAVRQLARKLGMAGKKARWSLSDSTHERA